jgi:hypothetical protein
MYEIKYCYVTINFSEDMSVNHIFRQLTAGISFNTKSFAGEAKRFGLAKTKESSVADPDPDPHVFGPSGSGSFYHHAKIV